MLQIIYVNKILIVGIPIVIITERKITTRFKTRSFDFRYLYCILLFEK
jgi:hypothetical protein